MVFAVHGIAYRRGSQGNHHCLGSCDRSQAEAEVWLNTIPRSFWLLVLAATVLLAATFPIACRLRAKGIGSDTETNQATDQGGIHAGDGSVNVNIPLAITLGPWEVGGFAAAGLFSSGVLGVACRKLVSRRRGIERMAKEIEKRRGNGATVEDVVTALQHYCDAPEREINCAVRRVT